MHLVIASHTEPPLPLPRLLAANDLTNITASDLRFTLEEVAEFLGGVTGLQTILFTALALLGRSGPDEALVLNRGTLEIHFAIVAVAILASCAKPR